MAADLLVQYQHHDSRLGVNFQVHRLPFEALQALEPRLIRIPPGACNEKHRHAHVSIFVVLEGGRFVPRERIRVQTSCRLRHPPSQALLVSRAVSGCGAARRKPSGLTPVPRPWGLGVFVASLSVSLSLRSFSETKIHEECGPL